MADELVCIHCVRETKFKTVSEGLHHMMTFHADKDLEIGHCEIDYKTVSGVDMRTDHAHLETNTILGILIHMDLLNVSSYRTTLRSPSGGQCCPLVVRMETMRYDFSKMHITFFLFNIFSF